MISSLAFFPVLTIFILSFYMIEEKSYEDGIVGRIALVWLFGLSLITMTAIIFGHSPFNGWFSVAFLWAFSLFLSRHVYRFAKWKYAGKFSWKKADPEKTAEWTVK